MWMRISRNYIPNEYQKLDIYKRIAGIEDEEEMDDMLEELIDRFGMYQERYSSFFRSQVLKRLHIQLM